MEKVKLRPRCVYVDGKPLPLKILLVKEEIVRVIVIVGCKEFYAFSFKEDVKEYIKKTFGVENFEIQDCRE
jgi:hypothetical protein